MLAIMMTFALQAATVPTLEASVIERQKAQVGALPEAIGSDLETDPDIRFLIYLPYNPEMESSRERVAGIKARHKFDEAWVFVARGAKTIQMVRVKDLQNGNPTGSFWVQVYEESATKPGEIGERSLFKQTLSCKDETQSLIANLRYTPAGKIISSITVEPDEQKTIPVPPGSVADKIMKAVCTPASS